MHNILCFTINILGVFKCSISVISLSLSLSLSLSIYFSLVHSEDFSLSCALTFPFLLLLHFLLRILVIKWKKACPFCRLESPIIYKKEEDSCNLICLSFHPTLHLYVLNEHFIILQQKHFAYKAHFCTDATRTLSWIWKNLT